MIFFATSAANYSDLVLEEAKRAGGVEAKTSTGGVEFSGDLSVGYRFTYNTRLASRVLLGLYYDNDVRSTEELTEATGKIPWEDYIEKGKTIKITASGEVWWIRNLHYGVQCVKDGIVDRLREVYEGERPNVDVKNPDIGIHVHFFETTVKWYLDFSGEGLHMRGYRDEQTDAILKESLAACLLERSDWYKTVKDENPAPLLDPFTGSGTIAIEAALMASDTAPGLIRKRPYLFEKLPNFDRELYEKIIEEAKERRDKALKERNIKIYASDKMKWAVDVSDKAAKRAGVNNLIKFQQIDFGNIETPPAERGYIVTDPPYGERMKEKDLNELYEKIGNEMTKVFKGWKATILTGDSELLTYIDMKPDRTNVLYNGPIECQIAHYTIFTEEEKKTMTEKAIKRREERLNASLKPNTEALYQRVKENYERLKSIMSEEGVTSYRIYDRELEQFPASIDFYEGKWVVVNEYWRSDEDERLSKERIDEVVLVAEKVTMADYDSIYLKSRREMKGKNQYSKLASSNRLFIGHENGLITLLNFTNYIDTGLFLDTRPVRAMIQNMAKNKRFLNLFSYTGTATLNAIKGGALSTVSVDSSNTYLSWFVENLKVNKFSTSFGNYMYKADVMEWLWATYDKFDLIYCDPPTFSNSTDRNTFDIQKDHVKLIKATAMHLAPKGEIIFVTNYRRFRMDEEILRNYYVEDITDKTIGDDFSDKNVHKCYLIKNKIKISIKAKSAD